VSKKNLGSNIDDFLKKENIFEEAQAQAIKEVVAWQLATAMKKKKISKTRTAALLKDEPLPGRSHSRSETRYYVVEFAAGGGIGGAAGRG
jgi:mannose-6-phosphate isomerase-like protein (cupin superfamily)